MLRGKRGRAAYGALSVLTEIVHVFSMEYFWGFELIRPYLIWKSIPLSLGTRKRMINTFIAWIPYLVIFIAAIIWRFKFAQIAEEDPNSLRFFSELFSAPLQLPQVHRQDINQAIIMVEYLRTFISF